MKKIIFIVVLLAGLALAEPITNFQAVKPFPSVMYGGKTYQVDYQLSSDDDLPAIVNLKITSNNVINTDDINVEAFINSDGLNCSSVEGKIMDIKCYNGTGKYIIPSGTNHIYF
ncbi:MAG: hypothetical protein V1900_04090, partial [Candidatus Aenigmatarchaeota archaeon]